MSNRYHVKNDDGQGTVKKSRFTEANTGQRMNLFTSDDLFGTAFPTRFNNGDRFTEVMAFEGSRPQDARVTLASGAFDRVEITAKNEDFETDRPIYLRVRKAGVVIFCQKLDVSRFVAAEDAPPEENGFRTRQIQIGMVVENDGNYDIDLEQDKRRKRGKAEVSVGGNTIEVETIGESYQVSFGRFAVSEINVTGNIRTATEVRNDEQNGTVEDLNGQPYSVPTGATLRGALASEERKFNSWQSRKDQKGEYVEKFSGVPNVDPFAPEGLVRVNFTSE